MSSIRTRSFAAALLVGGLGLAPASIAEATSPTATAAAAGKNWHRQVSLGTGKRAAKVDTCFTADGANAKAWFRLTTRSSTDRRYPRISIHIVDGSQVSDSETTLMPGRRKQSFSNGPWSAAGAVTITVHNQGRTTTKNLAVGSLGAC